MEKKNILLHYACKCILFVSLYLIDITHVYKYIMLSLMIDPRAKLLSKHMQRLVNESLYELYEPGGIFGVIKGSLKKVPF